MKKVILSLVCFVCIGVLSFGQDAKKITYASVKQIEDFFKSKTMVVMDADALSGFNFAIPDIMKKYWTITPYEIIPDEQFDKIRTDPNISFIYLSKVRMARDKQLVYYLYMDIVMGAKVKDLISMPVLLSIPLAYSGVDEDDYLDKLPLMIRFAQSHLNLLKDSKNPRTLNNPRYYNSDSKLLLDKTLLVKESDLAEEVNTVEKIQKYYPGKVKIVSSEELVKAIEEKAPDTAVLHQMGPEEGENKGHAYCQIFGTDDAKLYYYNHQTITQRRPEGMRARDFRLIMGKWF